MRLIYCYIFKLIITHDHCDEPLYFLLKTASLLLGHNRFPPLPSLTTSILSLIHITLRSLSQQQYKWHLARIANRHRYLIHGQKW